MEKVEKLINDLIDKIESETFSIYTYEEVLDMLEDLKHDVKHNGGK